MTGAAAQFTFDRLEKTQIVVSSEPRDDLTKLLTIVYQERMRVAAPLHDILTSGGCVQGSILEQRLKKLRDEEITNDIVAPEEDFNVREKRHIVHLDKMASIRTTIPPKGG